MGGGKNAVPSLAVEFCKPSALTCPQAPAVTCHRPLSPQHHSVQNQWRGHRRGSGQSLASRWRGRPGLGAVLAADANLTVRGVDRGRRFSASAGHGRPAIFLSSLQPHAHETASVHTASGVGVQPNGAQLRPGADTGRAAGRSAAAWPLARPLLTSEPDLGLLRLQPL